MATESAQQALFKQLMRQISGGRLVAQTGISALQDARQKSAPEAAPLWKRWVLG